MVEDVKGFYSKLKAALSATAVATAISYIFLAILASQPNLGTGANRPLSIVTGVAFLIAFLVSCLTLGIANSQRRSLR